MPLRDDLQNALGGSYTLERELGGGGMSRVFIAQDTSLGRSVVVKVLPPEMVGSVNFERFRREIQLAARLQHACIVPVLAAGAADGIPYYTMPFIDGESLRRKLARGGELPVADAVRILRDMAEALSYAHEQGVVHRDIKPDNVLLGKHHAQVADFGVAKALSASTQAKGVTSIGVALGTPAYMAPEQAAGDPQIDHRADIYALGVTAYEMLSGTTPFAGRSPQSMLAAHATESPPPLEQVRPTVPAPLAALVNRCLAKRAADRPQSADEVLEALAALVTPTGGLSPTTATPSPSAGRKWIWIGATVAVAVAVVAGAAIALHARTPALNAKRVVVAELDNETGDTTLTPLGRMTAEWLSRGLDQTGIIDVAYANVVSGPGGATDSAMKLRGVARARSAAAVTRAGTVVWGAFYRQNDSLRFQMQVMDVASGKSLRSFDPVSGPSRDRDRLLESLRQQVVGGLASILDERIGSTISTKQPLPNYDAYREYVQGNEDFVVGRWAGSIQHFSKAVELDSTFILPYLGVASALWNLNQWARLDSVARVVTALQARRWQLSPVDADIAEWVAVSSRHDLAGLLRVTERMTRRDSTDVELYLVGLLNLFANRPRLALDAFDREHEVERSSGFYGYWAERVYSSHLLGDFKTGIADAGLAARAYPKIIGPVRLRAMSLAAIGNIGDVRRIADSLRVLGAGGTNVGPPLTEIATELRAHGHPAEARPILEMSVEWQHSRPEAQQKTAAARFALAAALYELERWDEARAIYDSLSHEVPSNIDYLGSVGVVAASKGDRAEAVRVDSLLAVLPGPYLYGLNTRWRARIAGALGDGARAVSLLKQSMNEGRQFDFEIHSEKAFERIRTYGPFQDFLKPKG
jgi:serine/threonine-protein kinase